MATYRGFRDEHGAAHVTVGERGHERPLTQFVRHSPAGMDWGYGGSGPADLARSLLAHHLRASVAPPPRIYQSFKFAVVGRLAADAWMLTTADIDAALQEILRQHNISCPLCADEGVLWSEQYANANPRRRGHCTCEAGQALARLTHRDLDETRNGNSLC